MRLGTGWLAAYENAIRRFPDADYFGGRILPDWGSKKPRWIGDEPLPLIDGLLVWLITVSRPDCSDNGEPTPFGASFAIDGDLFEKIGLFPRRPRYRRNGTGAGRGN